jgi:transcriptional regulator with XRE-family HTH domain
MPTNGQAGALLRAWRASRRMSQLALALDAGISPRHLSAIETGKALPSREVLAQLADVLKMPLRERNQILKAAGYRPEYPETELDTEQLAQVRRAIDAILAHQEPYPAFVVDRRWEVLRANRGAARIARFLGVVSVHTNMVHQLFDPADLRAYIINWEELAGDVIRHLHDDVAAFPSDAQARTLLEDALRYPGVPAAWRTRQLGAVPPPMLTTQFRKDGRTLVFFSTITTFGTPRDVTLDELRIECTFPSDEATAELCRALARDDPDPM